MQVPTIHGDSFIRIATVNISTNVITTRRSIQNHYQKPILAIKGHYSHIKFLLMKIISHQVKSLVIMSNPKFSIIERSIVQKISQHQVRVLSDYQASCQNSKHCSSISINQIMSNSCSTNFKHNDISICMS